MGGETGGKPDIWYGPTLPAANPIRVAFRGSDLSFKIPTSSAQKNFILIHEQKLME